MSKKPNLSSQIESQLPTELVAFMRTVGEVATRQGLGLYLVGGVVRDLLLGQTNLDLDLVVEGDAVNLAQQLSGITRAKMVVHPRFRTAKLRWGRWSVDLATARSETYAKPGALPTVKPGSIESDLFRRDFTINAMAVRLNPSHYGDLIDLYGGKNDLERKLIRILHEKSFIDDATRIWRGLRYEQRLNFQLEADTLRLLKRDVPMLDTISGDRIRHELELILKEEFPEKVLQRADELGVLAKLHPALKGNGWLADKFMLARELSATDLSPVALYPTLLMGLYLALLGYRLPAQENEELIARLRLPKTLCQVMRDTLDLKAKLESLARPRLKPSRVYHLLHGYSLIGITANSLASDSPAVYQHIQLFLGKLRFVKPALTGDDLEKIGIAPGPKMKEILKLLHDARLDGKVTSKQGEVKLVKRWIR